MGRKYDYSHKVTVPNLDLYEAQDGECTKCGPVRVFYKFRRRNKNKHTFVCSKRQYELEKEKGIDFIHKRNYNQWKREQSLSNDKQNESKWNKRLYDLKRSNKLTLNDIYDKLDLQKEQCSICLIKLTSIEEWKNTLKKNWVIDHDHSCCGETYSYSKNVKRVLCGNCNRDLLCNNCNTAIGLLKENTTNLNNAILYLDKYNT